MKSGVKIIQFKSSGVTEVIKKSYLTHLAGVYKCSTCVSGSAGGRGEADGERERTSAEIWRAADGEGVAAQQCSEILSKLITETSMSN